MPIANIGAVPDVATATAIASDWGNATGSSSRGRVVQRFNTPAERDASITAPTPGMVCYVASTNIFYGYANPGGWTTLNWAPGTWHARVGRAAAQNILATSATPMPCDTVGEDPTGMYSLSTKLFTVPVPGIYLLCGKIEMTCHRRRPVRHHPGRQKRHHGGPGHELLHPGPGADNRPVGLPGALRGR